MTTTAAPPFRASRYTTGAVLLHWLIAALILVQLAGGYAMTDILGDGTSLQFDVYQLHKSFGVTVLVLTIARILWRLFNPPPPEPVSVSRLEAIAARVVHIAFYVLLLVIPMTGWLIISASEVDLDTELFFARWLPFPDLPWLGGLDTATRHAIEEAGESVHAFLAYSTLALVFLHVAGALKHQVTHGGFLGRMGLGGRGDGPRRSYGHATTWLVTLVVFGALVGSAAFARYGSGTPAEPAEHAASGVSPDEATAPGAGGASAQAPATAAGEAPLWTVLPEESRIGYAFSFDRGTVTGELPSFEVEVRFDENNLGGSSIGADIALDAVTVAGGGVRPSQIKGADGLDVSAHPHARFEADTIEAGDSGGFVAHGTLAVRGATKDVTLPFTLEKRDDGRILAKGTASLDRTAFGFAEGLGQGGPSIGPTVDITLEILAQPPEEDGTAR